MSGELRKLVAEIGGSERLHDILLKFYQAMSHDVMIGFFFTGRDLAIIAKNQGQFILKAAGLSTPYDGKTPSTAHLALAPILSGHFDRRLKILETILHQEKVSAAGIESWLKFENAFRAVVISHSE